MISDRKLKIGPLVGWPGGISPPGHPTTAMRRGSHVSLPSRPVMPKVRLGTLSLAPRQSEAALQVKSGRCQQGWRIVSAAIT